MAADSEAGTQRLGESVQEVSERLSTLVREEIELAKAEVSEKVSRLVKAAVVGIVAGIFAVVALLFLLHGVAWVFAQYVFTEFHPGWGYLVTGGLLLILGGIAGFVASRLVKRGTPPTPELAIEEAKRIKETVTEARSG